MEFISLEEARLASGPKLVVAASLPSPWSEAAKGILHVKGIDAKLVRFSSTDTALREWMGWHNVPVLLVPGEPIRTHWTDILETAERIAPHGSTPLVPREDGERMRLFGLAHELLGENGLMWCGRLLVIHRGLETDGKEGFPVRIAKYLAPKYGYAPERIDAARARVRSLLDRFGELVDGKTYALGANLTALDLYLATAIAPFGQMPVEQCPGTHPSVRHAFETALREPVPPAILAHRNRIYEKHLELPVQL